MATPYDLKKKRDMSKDAPVGSQLYYAVSSSKGVCRAETLYASIADRSALTVGDVKNVVDGALYLLEQRLAEGQSVQLGEFGYFTPVLGSSGVKDPKDFKPAMIKTRRIAFRPGKQLMEFARGIQVEHVGEGGIPVPDVPNPNPDGGDTGGGGDDVLS